MIFEITRLDKYHIESMIDVSYSELSNLVGKFVPGQQYRITDFKTTHTIPYTDPPVINEGVVEALIVTAATSSTLEIEARSEDFPQDIIRYLPMFDNTSLTEFPYGCISYREDTVRNIRMHEDWRGIKYARYALEPATVTQTGPLFDTGLVSVTTTDELSGLNRYYVIETSADGTQFRVRTNDTYHIDWTNIELSTFNIQTGTYITFTGFPAPSLDMIAEIWKEFFGYNTGTTYGRVIVYAINNTRDLDTIPTEEGQFPPLINNILVEANNTAPQLQNIVFGAIEYLSAQMDVYSIEIASYVGNTTIGPTANVIKIASSNGDLIIDGHHIEMGECVDGSVVRGSTIHLGSNGSLIMAKTPNNGSNSIYVEDFCRATIGSGNYAIRITDGAANVVIGDNCEDIVASVSDLTVPDNTAHRTYTRKGVMSTEIVNAVTGCGLGMTLTAGTGNGLPAPNEGAYYGNLDDQMVYFCNNGIWSVFKLASLPISIKLFTNPRTLITGEHNIVKIDYEHESGTPPVDYNGYLQTVICLHSGVNIPYIPSITVISKNNNGDGNIIIMQQWSASVQAHYTPYFEFTDIGWGGGEFAYNVCNANSPITIGRQLGYDDFPDDWCIISSAASILTESKQLCDGWGNNAELASDGAYKRYSLSETEYINMEHITSDNHVPAGFIDHTNSQLIFYKNKTLPWTGTDYTPASNNFIVEVIPTNGTSFPLYIDGNLVYKYAGNAGVSANPAASDIISLTPTLDGRYFIYYDVDRTLKYNPPTINGDFSDGTWNLEPDGGFKGEAHVCTIVWKYNSGTGITDGFLEEERHHSWRDIHWHHWAHHTVGPRYTFAHPSNGNGLTILAPNTTNSPEITTISEGAIYDEDIKNYMSQQSSCRVFYGDITTINWVDSTFLYKTNLGTAQDNPQYWDTINHQLQLVPAGNASYFVSWIYATNCVDKPIAVVLDQRAGAAVTLSLANAQAAVPPTIYPGFVLEWKLIWKVIFRYRTAGTPDVTWISNTDYRSTSSLPAGQTPVALPTASAVSEIVDGNVQLALNNIRSNYIPYTNAVSAVDLGLQNLSTSGTIGIGTNIPSGALHIKSQSTTGNTLLVTNSSDVTTFSVSANGAVYLPEYKKKSLIQSLGVKNAGTYDIDFNSGTFISFTASGNSTINIVNWASSAESVDAWLYITQGSAGGVITIGNASASANNVIASGAYAKALPNSGANLIDSYCFTWTGTKWMITNMLFDVKVVT